MIRRFFNSWLICGVVVLMNLAVICGIAFGVDIRVGLVVMINLISLMFGCVKLGTLLEDK